MLVPGIDESIADDTPPRKAALEIAIRKARCAAGSYLSSAKPARAAVILAADTVVYARAELLGKAPTPAAARRMLQKISGTTHEVYTGVSWISVPDGRKGSFAVKTKLTMRRWRPAEINAYIQSNEWKGKAGAYAIQESADRFVTSISGSFTNVVGLPMERVERLLESLSIPRKGKARGRGSAAGREDRKS